MRCGTSTTLHEAAECGDLPFLVKAAMLGGIMVNGVDDRGRTALHIACSKNQFPFVRYLLNNAETDVSIRDKDGKTALQLCPPSARKEMTLLFSQVEARKQEKQGGSSSDGLGKAENDEMLEETDVNEFDVVNPRTMRRIVACLVLPFLFLIAWNGFLFAIKFITVSMGFYFVSAAYFISEIATHPPWYHHRYTAKRLTVKGCPMYWSTWVNDPKTDFNIDYEDVAFDSTDGYTLRGWYVPPRGLHRTTGIVLVHGGGRDRRAWLRHVPFLHKAGYGCLLFDLREHGLSDGKARGLTYGIKERFDVISACQMMRTTYGYEKVCAMGTSIGGASAIMAGSIDQSIDMVIAENAITTSATLQDQQVVQYLGGYFSQRTYSLVLFKAFRRVCSFWLNLRIGNMPSKHCQALHCIHKIAPRPVLLMHGTVDTIVPCKHSTILYDAAGEPKELYLCEGAFHCGLYNTFPEEYESKVLNFLERYGRDRIRKDV